MAPKDPARIFMKSKQVVLIISIVGAINSLSVVEKVERWTTDTAGLVEKAKNINWIPPVNFNRQIPAVFVCYIKDTERGTLGWKES